MENKNNKIDNTVAEVLAQMQRDRRQIARLTEALEQIARLPIGKQRPEDGRCGYCHSSFATEQGCAMCSTGGTYSQARNAWRSENRIILLERATISDAPAIARAVLAGEEGITK